MNRWFAADGKRTLGARVFVSSADGLRKIYRDRILPLEADHDFQHFFSPPLTDSDFSARPMILLLGQYSAGKSTFIRHLIGRDYPGLRIGPEPTTDKFVAVSHGSTDQVIPGNAAVVDQGMPFTQLSHFGNNFLTRFEVSRLDCACLEGVTLIDTPGVLSGEKQRVQRGYDFDGVVRWFADRVDMIILLFDVNKLDISDEMRQVILAVKGNDQKIHVVLNKADRCSASALMRVYGALMWNLGKVVATPEVSRVYIGSFWDEPLDNDEMRRLFESEENDLYTALSQLPRGAAVRKLNDLIKRARLAKVNAHLQTYLRSKMPSIMGVEKKKKELLLNLVKVYEDVAKEKNLPLGDFPNPTAMGEKLASQDFKKFKKVDVKKLERLEEALSVEVPHLLEVLANEPTVEDRLQLTQIGEKASPFAVLKVGGDSEGTTLIQEFLCVPDLEQYRAEFEALHPSTDGKLSGAQAKPAMVSSKLPSNVLHKVWTMADRDSDGMLTLQEFALAKHLMRVKLAGIDLPREVPPQMLGALTPQPPAAQLPTEPAAAAAPKGAENPLC